MSKTLHDLSIPQTLDRKSEPRGEVRTRKPQDWGAKGRRGNLVLPAAGRSEENLNECGLAHGIVFKRCCVCFTENTQGPDGFGLREINRTVKRDSTRGERKPIRTKTKRGRPLCLRGQYDQKLLKALYDLDRSALRTRDHTMSRHPPLGTRRGIPETEASAQ